MPNPRRNKSSSLLWLLAVVAAPPVGCAVFPGSLTRDGYGIVQHDARSKRAHVLAFVFAYGPVPAGRMVLHGKGGKRCESPACCNPTHLYAGTAQDNMDDRSRDGMAPAGDNHYARQRPEVLARGDRNGARARPETLHRGADHWSARMPERRLVGDKNPARQRPERMARGEGNGNHKLTEAEVTEILRRQAAGETRCSLAAEFGVSGAMVGNIVARKAWRHVKHLP